MRHILLMVSVLIALDAGAATFVVNSTADQSDAVPGNGFCSVMTGICTLRAAIQEANALAGPDTIQLPANLYALSIAGVGEEMAATGDLDIRDDLTIDGAAAGTTFVDASTLDRVFHVQPMNSATLSVTIRDVTIQHGATTDIPGGGILHSDEGTLTVEDAVFDGNHVSGTTSSATGGAVASVGGGHLTVRRSLFFDDSASAGGAVFSNGTLRSFDSTFDSNTTTVGAVIDSYGPASVERCTFAGNQGSVIGSRTGSFIVSNSTLSGNVSSPGSTIVAVAPVVLGNSTVFGNSADRALAAYVAVSISNSVLAGNSAGDECVSYGGTITSLGHNLDDDGSCANGGPGDLPARDPLLGPLADNSGPTLTHLPALASPLANAGDNASCPLEDQRGFLRSVGPANGCDIGSVEFAVPEPAAASLGAASLLALAALRRSSSRA